MEEVITINNWCDGPLLGLAYYHGAVCIYERVFDETIDDWSDEFDLTPIDFNSQNKILNEWHKWCDAVSANAFDDYYAAHSGSRAINNAIEESKSKRKYRKKAIFNGHFETGFIPVNYTVEWI